MKELSSIQVLPILESLALVKKQQLSVIRFGDGEVDLMTGSSIPYQSYDAKLAEALRDILRRSSDDKCLICLPDVFARRERYNQNFQVFWDQHLDKYADFYAANCQAPFYGSTFISRPYIDLEDKSESAHYFEGLKSLWQNQDLLIVEGETSRSGVGNDLFAEAKSIKRIICPSKDAFGHYDEILDKVAEHAKGRLVLVMLGPTAKVLVEDLSDKGFQAIDLGHIDSEYEWFLMGATRKVKLGHKHTAEFNYDEDIQLETDEVYQGQILAKVGIKQEETKEEEGRRVSHPGLISIIVPVYNVEQYLGRCLNALLKQTYTNFELLLINDGSTDGSGPICEDYAQKDERIRVLHQVNAGPSAARNAGIAMAKGEFITFVDADDFVEDYYLEHLHQALVKNDSDIAICNFNSFNEERQSYLFAITSEMYFEKNYSVQDWLNQENNPRYNLFLTFTFSPTKLFRAHLFDGIYFPLGRLREDDATIYRLYLKAKQITFINEGSYYYSQRASGLSRSQMHKDIASMISNAEERLALLAALGYDLTAHLKSYKGRLEVAQRDALSSGQIELYHQCSNKLDLINQYQKQD